MATSDSVYDRNDYYGSDVQGSRLAPFLNPLLRALDRWKAECLIAKLGVKKGYALDVGAGDGKFLLFLKQKGFHVFGTTASRISGEAALKQNGITLEVSKNIPPELSHRKYDLITYWHVFEHLENPESHAVKWADLLTDRGSLVIEVPNVDSIGAHLNFDCWLGSDPVHHLNHQPEANILSLLKRSGLLVKRIERFSLKFSYVFLWSALLGLLFNRLYSFDRVLNVLKFPARSFRDAPFRTLNALAAIVYLSPIIFVCLLIGPIFRRGEVFRVYAGKS